MTILSFVAVFTPLGVASSSYEYVSVISAVVGVFLGRVLRQLILRTLVGWLRRKPNRVAILWIVSGAHCGFSLSVELASVFSATFGIQDNKPAGTACVKFARIFFLNCSVPTCEKFRDNGRENNNLSTKALTYGTHRALCIFDVCNIPGMRCGSVVRVSPSPLKPAKGFGCLNSGEAISLVNGFGVR